jgi:Rrf2 family protein
MVYMAGKSGRGPVTKHEIALAEGISVDYVGQILVRLRTAGLATSFRGKKGGFVLVRDPATITVADVVRATEGPIALAPCREGPCRRASSCAMQSVWKKAVGAMENVLEETTLRDVAEEAKRIAAQGSVSFDI